MLDLFPKIDNRSAEDIVTKVKEIADIDSRPGSFTDALARIFGRYCEIIIERLNKVPEKNYIAFLNELGISQNPPIPATVPLTFIPVKKNNGTTITVPKFTKVTSSQGKGEDLPVVFETMKPLSLTHAELRKVILIDTVEDKYTDHNLSIEDKKVGVNSTFKGTSPINHQLCIAITESLATVKEVDFRLLIRTEDQRILSKKYTLEWLIINDQGEEVIIQPYIDSTNEFIKSGEIAFKNLPNWKASTIAGKCHYWLSCRLSLKKQREQKKESEIKLPIIESLKVSSNSKIEDSKIELAISNNSLVDLSKDFYLFGKNPSFGDVFYFCADAFNQIGSEIKAVVELTNSASSSKEPPIPRVNQEAGAVIQWEYWNGISWTALKCKDTTKAMTENGVVSFHLPEDIENYQIMGQEKKWIRARLISGNYGHEAGYSFVNANQAGQNFQFHSSTLSPPSIKSLSVRSYSSEELCQPETIIKLNDFQYEEIDLAKFNPFKPFHIGQFASKALYLGFKADDPKTLTGQWLDIYFHLCHDNSKLFYRGNQQIPALSWQCWNGNSWQTCKIFDETQSLHVSGSVSLLLPESIATWNESNFKEEDGTPLPKLYLVRAVAQIYDQESCPILEKVLLNTVIASQALTMNNEIIGSGNNLPNQSFFSARTPILGNLQLEIREPYLPSQSEWQRIISDEGQDSITINSDSFGKIEDVWVRWHEVGDFLNSNADDRHYVVERLGGEIRFGDGHKGMCPPSGANNIRLKSYKTVGGKSGNNPANSIKQLNASLPFVESVFNPIPSSGGQDIESWDSVYKRGATFLRHRNHAVTTEDYEDLALQYSRDIARCKCVPLKDLSSDSWLTRKLGALSLIIVPENLQTEPKPTLELLRGTWNFFEDKRDQTAELIVVGPKYIRLNVELVIVSAGEGDIVTECARLLKNYLHPLTGGENSRGWAFGQIPHRSDLIALLEPVSGIEYIQSIHISQQEEQPGLLQTGLFLISSGTHKIHLV